MAELGLVFEHSDCVGSAIFKETELADRAQPNAKPRCWEPATSTVYVVLNLRTTTSQKCEAVPRRARISGS